MVLTLRLIDGVVPEIQVEVNLTDRQADIVEEGFELAVRIGEASPDTRLVSRVASRRCSPLTGRPC